MGADGRLIWNQQGEVYNVNLTEKLLVTVLNKLSTLFPEAGIWMNTQRPEWNDANNALVGYGVSMVTLYYTRRYQKYLLELFANVDFEAVQLSSEVAGLLEAINTTLVDHQQLLQGRFSDAQRKQVLDSLGQAASDYREGIYDNAFSGEHAIKVSDLVQFLEISIAYIDHTIEANRRDDGLYHAYNPMTATDTGVEITYLYEMLGRSGGGA